MYVCEQFRFQFYLCSHILSSRQYSTVSNIVIFRNLVYAPISEEIVFRSLMIHALLSAKLLHEDSESNSYDICIYSIMWFGFAHIHHFYDKVFNIKIPLASAIGSTLLQLAYTSFFAYIASILLLRTGNILSPITSHVICNFVGLPDVGFLEARGNSLSFLYSYKYILVAVHGAGLILFFILLYPMTQEMAEISPLWVTM